MKIIKEVDKRNEEIQLIRNRIVSEYKKHNTLDWAYIAAKKIYYSHIEYKNENN